MIEYLQSDISLEEQARLNLGLKKANEDVVVVNRQSVAQVASVSEVAVSSRNINWDKWLSYFFK